MLDRLVIMISIQFYCLISHCSVLVLGRVFSDPEVEIVFQIILVWVPGEKTVSLWNLTPLIDIYHLIN